MDTHEPVASSSTVDNFSRVEAEKKAKHLCGVYWSRLFIFADFFYHPPRFHSANRCLRLNLLERDIIGRARKKREFNCCLAACRMQIDAK